MKSRGHIYMADLLYRELNPDLYGGPENTGRTVKLRTDPDATGKSEWMEFQVPEQIYDAIRYNRGCFLAGAVGPDFFPDMITGQMRVHPQNSGKWLEMMFEQLRMLPPYSQEFRKALAFYMGWMMHCCGDMYSHQFVNLYAYGWFPSLGEMAEDAKAIMQSAGLKAIMEYIGAHLERNELEALLANPSAARLMELLMNDPNAVKELEQKLEELKDSEDPWKVIGALLTDAVHLLKLVNSLLNILRHLTLEAHLDNIIQQNLEARAADGRLELTGYYDIEIPRDFIRSCFITPEAFRRMQQLCGETPGDPGNPADILQKYVEHYEAEFQENLRHPEDHSIVENLKLRSRYLDKWVNFWETFVDYDLKYGTPIPEGYGEHMYYALSELITAALTEDEDDIRDMESFNHGVYVFLGLFEPFEFVLDCFEQFFLWLIDPLISVVKDGVAPLLTPIANALVAIGAVEHSGGLIDTYDEATEVIGKAFTSPRMMLRCQALFNVENLDEKLDREWQHMGKDRTCFDLECPMLENALQMGKLCLMGTESLSRLFAAHIGETDPFESAEMRWSLSDLEVEIIPGASTFKNKGYLLYLNVRRDTGEALERHLIWDGRKKHISGPVAADLRLVSPLSVWNLRSCSLSVARESGAYADEQLECRVNLYSKENGQLLLSGNLILSNCHGSEKSCHDNEQLGQTLAQKMDNVNLIESLYSLSVVIETTKTKDGGTDGDPVFSVIDHSGNVLAAFKPNRGAGYNDFEQGDKDTYSLTLPRHIGIDEVKGFSIHKDGGDAWNLKQIYVIENRTGMTIGKLSGPRWVSSGRIEFPLIPGALKAPELELQDDLIESIDVIITTADRLYAGTDNDIYVKLYRGDTCLLRRQVDTIANDNERGDTCTCAVHVDAPYICLGDVTGVAIEKVQGRGQMDDEWTISQIRIVAHGRKGIYTLANNLGRHVLGGDVKEVTISSIYT